MLRETVKEAKLFMQWVINKREKGMLTFKIKVRSQALAGWLSWLECHPVHQKVEGLIPSPGAYSRQLINVYLSHLHFSLPQLPLSLYKINF